MKLKHLREFQDEGIDLTPMIDVVFLLVIFFMVTTTFIEEAKVYSIELPKGKKPETISRQGIPVLSVTMEGEIYLRTDGEDKKMDDLQAAMEKLAAFKEKEDPPKGVILRCDAHSNYENYLQAKNAIRMAGWDMIFEEVEVR